MLHTPIEQFLFVDIETVGISSDYKNFSKDYPELRESFDNYLDWFLKRFPEDFQLTKEEIFVNRAALVPEFSKIICVSFAFLDKEGTIRKQTFFNSDEGQLLRDVNNLLNRTAKLNFVICGHNIKNFDIPVLAKRMIVNGILPSKMLPSYDTKPWEVKAFDTKEYWQYGMFGALSSLDLMCKSLGIESSKNSEVTGNKVHNSFWMENKYDEIQQYCEKDVEVLINIVQKLKKLS